MRARELLLRQRLPGLPKLSCLGPSAGLLVCPVAACCAPPASSPLLIILCTSLLGFLVHLQSVV